MKKVVICPRYFQKNLLQKMRAEDPFCDVKIVSKESLIGEWLGKAEPNAYLYIIKNYHLNYDNAQAIIPYLPYVNEKIPFLYSIKKDLIEHHLFVKNEYLNTFFLGKKVEIYGYFQEDKELLSLLNHFQLDYDFVTIGSQNPQGNVLIYETAFDEVFYTLNQIADLINHGTDINDIYIYLKNDEYKYYLRKFSPNFGFSLDLDSSYSLFETPIANKFLSIYKESKNVTQALFDIDDCHDKDLLEAFKEVIDSSLDEGLSFSSQYEVFEGELRRTKYGNKNLDNVVRVIDKPIYVKDKEIFVLSFAQGIYPSTLKDNKLLSDKDLSTIGMNTSNDAALINENNIKEFLRSENHFHFSFSNHSLNSKYFISPWVEEFSLIKEVAQFPHIIYSNDMRDFYYAKVIDIKENYSDILKEYSGLKNISHIPYGEYHNDFTGVQAFSLEEKITYSYSQISTFYQCPFQYYLSRVIDVDPFEGNFATKFGSVAHAVFQHMNDRNFNFDKVFDTCASEQGFSPEEEALLKNLKEQIREAYKAAKFHQHYMNNPKIITERDITIPINENSFLTGKIDKTIILYDKYIGIVDYKTGSDSFNSANIEDGVSLQLPTYCLLASKDKVLKDYPIIGVFINNVVDTALSHEIKEENLINPYYRLNGKVVADVNYVFDLDSTISGGKAEFLKGVSLKADGSFKSSNNLVTPEEINDYIQIAMRKYQEADRRIRNNEFSINPLYIKKSDNACQYCEYRDICFVKPNQRRYLSDKKPEESEEEDNE